MDCFSIVSSLDKYWTSYGCVKLAGCASNVGAATFHPDVLLGLFSFEQCKYCFEQRCSRPFDCGFLLINKLCCHTQYQVIIKPFKLSLSKIEEIYVDSLGFLNVLRFDFCFKRSFWESPSLNAWGKGYECKLNSVEVSQITVFECMLGKRLDFGVLEITYGLERLISVLNPFWLKSFLLSSKECEFANVLGCVSVIHQFRLFNLYETYLHKIMSTGVLLFCFVYNAFLEMVFIYNVLCASLSLKRYILKLLLLKLQCVVCMLSSLIEKKLQIEDYILYNRRHLLSY